MIPSRQKGPVLLFNIFCAGLFFVAGCSKESAQPSELSEPVLTQQYRRESLTVIVSLSETNLTTSGKIVLMLDVHTPPGHKVDLPEIDEFVKPFSVADGYSEPIQTLPGGRHLHRRVWTLIPALPGTATLQPLNVSMGSTTIQTEPIAVEVASVLPPNLETYEIKDIAEPVKLLPEEKQRRHLEGVLSITAAALLLLFAAFKMSRRPKREIIPEPHATALQALEQLPADEMERVRALNAILLHYLAGRLQITTAGRTHHEIIAQLPKQALLGRRHPLERMLNASEQMRFSNHPTPGFAEQLEDYIRKFVIEMTEDPCD